MLFPVWPSDGTGASYQVISAVPCGLIPLLTGRSMSPALQTCAVPRKTTERRVPRGSGPTCRPRFGPGLSTTRWQSALADKNCGMVQNRPVVGDGCVPCFRGPVGVGTYCSRCLGPRKHATPLTPTRLPSMEPCQNCLVTSEDDRVPDGTSPWSSPYFLLVRSTQNCRGGVACARSLSFPV
jgi:hypothetical protein